MTEAEKRGYKRVVITKDVRGWPVGSHAWYDGSGTAWNDDCTKSWHHTVGANCEYATAHTLTPGQTYTSANGEGWECLAVRGDTAWMVRKDGDGDIFGSGWQFNIDGTTDTFGDNDDLRIVFEPVREDTRTRLYYSTMYGFEVADDGARADVILEIPFIDGKLDCTQAKVTPCD